MTDNLTLEQKIAECKKVVSVDNPVAGFIYFLNNYVFFEDKERHVATKLKLWPSQVDIVPTIVQEALIICGKARQLGITWLIACFLLWRLMTNQLYLALVISATEELSIEFLDRVYFVLDRLPLWLKPPTKTRTKQIFEFQHAKNLASTIKSLPNTEAGAQSKTPNVLVMDEACLSKLSSSIFNSSYPGIEAAKGQVIIISNSIKDKPGWNFFRDQYIASMRGMNKFKRIFLSWRAHPGRPETFIQDMISAGMSERDVKEHYPETEEAMIEDRNIRGVYYAKQMTDARKDKRICKVPWVPRFEVYTFWDLGVRDKTAIWFMQQIGYQFRFIDYYENTGMGMAFYAKLLRGQIDDYDRMGNYVYGDHYMPHDVEKRSLHGDTDVALSLKEVAENLGIEPILTVEKARDTQAVLNAIEAGRNILPQCCFDEDNCADGILALESYRSEWDEDTQVLGIKPLENFAIHAADSFRTFSCGYQQKTHALPEEKHTGDYMEGQAGTGWMGG